MTLTLTRLLNMVGLHCVQTDTIDDPQENGLYPMSDAVRDVYSSGDYLYLAENGDGLRIMGLQTSWVILKIEAFWLQRGVLWGVYVAGDYAYVAAAEGGLDIFQITIGQLRLPESITATLVGNYDTEGEASSVYVAEDYAYVTDAAGVVCVSST